MLWIVITDTAWGPAGWGQGLRGKSRLFLREVTHALGQQCSQTGTGLIAKDLPSLVKGRKQFENYPFLKNVAFALEEFSIYSEVIISEWKMFVQEGKALRSVESNLTHTLTTPLDSSAQQQLGLGRILQGGGYFPGIAHLHQISLCLSFGLSSGLPWSGRSGVRSADFSSGKKKSADDVTFFFPLTNHVYHPQLLHTGMQRRPTNTLDCRCQQQMGAVPR